MIYRIMMSLLAWYCLFIGDFQTAVFILLTAILCKDKIEW